MARRKGLRFGAATRAKAPEASREKREVRSAVSREVVRTAIDELDNSDDPLGENDDAPWDEPAHVVLKQARGHRGGKKVAARAALQGREGAPFAEGTSRAARQDREGRPFAEFQGLCLLCAQPGHRAGDCTIGPVCLRCGEVGHISRECPQLRPPRPRSPMDVDVEPSRKRVYDDGRGRRADVGASGHRAHAPVEH
ncbi:hypothetical protein QYE76_027208 [Lolium multiflorum]|uniref:CCHC-type domain-containing protein n=1 Tax=Lolium multiflorum TaxID=4521 RepID=A0AAD8QGR0_LOLMU|nr:hypothetical protein QYE76_027208 [Lolium multiflorum]